MMLPIIKTAKLSKTSAQLSVFNPVVNGLRCVIAKSDIKKDIKNMMPRIRPAIRNRNEYIFVCCRIEKATYQ